LCSLPHPSGGCRTPSPGNRERENCSYYGINEEKGFARKRKEAIFSIKNQNNIYVVAKGATIERR